MTDLFPPTEFDDWAESYDKSVGTSSGFPFEGYPAVLEAVVTHAAPAHGESVLDLGTGTGALAALFAARGCQIWGLDFSSEMLARARVKVPGAVFAQADLRAVWDPIFQRRFHCVVSAYTFHHFPLEEKCRLVQRILKDHLVPGGRLVIGDIAFLDAADQERQRKSAGQEWEQEYYWLADETAAAFAAMDITAHFHKISSYAGVFTFSP